MSKKIKRCENCYWYRWEDSVWGYCWRFPPQNKLIKIFPKIEYKMNRPEVLAEEICCGEFKERDTPPYPPKIR